MTIELEDVSVGYGGDPVLEHVDLTVEPGEVVALLGPNGVGKSTLLRTAIGLLDPLAGTVRIDGTPVSNLDRTEIARRVGYVPQDTGSTFPSTVFETVLMGRKPYIGWRPSRADETIVSDALATLGIESLAMRSVAELSGGQRQKVLLARALAQEPSMLVLDEPTSDLDIRHELEVLDTITGRLDDVGVLHAMHDITLAARNSDRFVLVADDGVYATGGREVLTAETIGTVFEVEVLVEETADGELSINPVGAPSR